MARKWQVTTGLLIAAVGSPVFAANGAALASARGAKTYGQYCAVCHGRNMAQPLAGSTDLRKFPADQGARFVKAVLNGKGTMPAWNGTLKPAQVDELWAYVVAGKTR